MTIFKLSIYIKCCTMNMYANSARLCLGIDRKVPQLLAISEMHH